MVAGISREADSSKVAGKIRVTKQATARSTDNRKITRQQLGHQTTEGQGKNNELTKQQLGDQAQAR